MESATLKVSINLGCLIVLQIGSSFKKMKLVNWEKLSQTVLSGMERVSFLLLHVLFQR